MSTQEQPETEVDFDVLDGDEEFTCPHCETSVGAESILGTLGKRTHYRCRYCGGEWSNYGT